MKRTIGTILILLFFMLLSTACAGTCTETDLLTRPEQQSPPNHSLVADLRPQLTWLYPPCNSEEYIINLWTNATNGSSEDTGFGGPTGSSDKNWTPPADLTTGTAYIWSVAAKNSTLISPYSPEWEFIVGPACGAADLIAPNPVSPTGNNNNLNPTYIWDYSDPACTPGGYSLQVAPNDSFTGLAVNMREANPIKAWVAEASPLTDCQRYYWRVAAIDGATDGPWSDVTSFRVNAFGTCVCLASELQVPFPVWPGHYEIVPTLQPVLRWLYSGNCQPEGYAVHVSTEYDMSDTSLFGGTGTPSTSWTTGVPLQPATQYWWQVASGVGTDFSGFSMRRSFFTGPECSAINDMQAPTLLSPINGDQVTEEFATLRYTPGAGGCIPDGYFVNLQTDPLFGGTNLLGSYHFPGTTVLTEPLDDCTIYYWKVAQIQGGVHGPESTAAWFYTNQSGTCPAPAGPMLGRPLRDLACREGPGLNYPPSGGFLLVNEMTEIYGRNALGDWLVLADLDGYGRCWTPSDGIEPSGDPFTLRIFNPPALPTPTPKPGRPVCSDKITDRDTCEAAGGIRTMRVTGGGYYCYCP